MASRAVVFLSLLSVVFSAEVENNKMMGVETVHDNNEAIKIDKDTIITRNLNLLDRNMRAKQANNKKQTEKEEDPDWSYSSFPPEVSAHVLEFKRNMTECLKEVQQKDKRPVKRMSPKMESPVHGECLIACVLKRNGIIDNGKIIKENLLNLVNKFYAKDTKLMKKLEKNLDRCIEGLSMRGDECTWAAQLNDCTNDLMASNKRRLVVKY